MSGVFHEMVAREEVRLAKSTDSHLERGSQRRDISTARAISWLEEKHHAAFIILAICRQVSEQALRPSVDPRAKLIISKSEGISNAKQDWIGFASCLSMPTASIAGMAPYFSCQPFIMASIILDGVAPGSIASGIIFMWGIMAFTASMSQKGRKEWSVL